MLYHKERKGNEVWVGNILTKKRPVVLKRRKA
jgi:hypothetical protein